MKLIFVFNMDLWRALWRDVCPAHIDPFLYDLPFPRGWGEAAISMLTGPVLMTTVDWTPHSQRFRIET